MCVCLAFVLYTRRLRAGRTSVVIKVENDYVYEEGIKIIYYSGHKLGVTYVFGAMTGTTPVEDADGTGLRNLSE